LAGQEKSGADFKSDLHWEALMPVFDGKLPLFVHASTLAQIEAALADRLGSLETGKAATLIVTNGAPLDFPT